MTASTRCSICRESARLYWSPFAIHKEGWSTTSVSHTERYVCHLSDWDVASRESRNVEQLGHSSARGGESGTLNTWRVMVQPAHHGSVGRGFRLLVPRCGATVVSVCEIAAIVDGLTSRSFFQVSHQLLRNSGCG